MGFFVCAWSEQRGCNKTSRQRFAQADQTVISICRDLQQLPHLRGEMSRQDMGNLERHTFDRLMTHLVNLPPLLD
jgi:hypothetical protein